MTFSAILFYILAAIVLYGALRTVTAKNPVHAALHLVLTFCVSAMIWMLMQAEFLGVTLVVVYVGAVMVLFLFVVMMLNIDIEEMRAGFWRHAPVAGVVGTLLAVALILILVNPKTDLAAFGLMKDIPADYNNIRDLGSRIYTDYLLPFELALRASTAPPCRASVRGEVEARTTSTTPLPTGRATRGGVAATTRASHRSSCSAWARLPCSMP